MARHALTTTALDTPGANYFLNRFGVAALTEAEYAESYDERRVYAAHRPAMFQSNRTDQWFEYREDVEAGTTFCELTINAIGMISNSYGWRSNRAWHVLSEAYRENDRIDFEAGGRNSMFTLDYLPADA
jgi:hypothetical protein